MEMMDYVHECLVCEGISYEIDGDEGYKLYRCNECAFEWEVIECGK